MHVTLTLALAVKVVKIPGGEVLTMPDYAIAAEFETGEVRRFDMRPNLDFPAFAPLKEPGLFLRAHVERGLQEMGSGLEK